MGAALISRMPTPMASRVARRLSPAVRSISRINAPSLARKRFLSSDQVSAKPSSDIPWIIGSTLIFGPALVYMISRSTNKKATHQDSQSHPSHHSASVSSKEEQDSDTPPPEETKTNTEDSPRTGTSSDTLTDNEDETSNVDTPTTNTADKQQDGSENQATPEQNDKSSPVKEEH